VIPALGSDLEVKGPAGSGAAGKKGTYRVKKSERGGGDIEGGAGRVQS